MSVTYYIGRYDYEDIDKYVSQNHTNGYTFVIADINSEALFEVRCKSSEMGTVALLFGSIMSAECSALHFIHSAKTVMLDVSIGKWTLKPGRYAYEDGKIIHLG